MNSLPTLHPALPLRNENQLFGQIHSEYQGHHLVDNRSNHFKLTPMSTTALANNEAFNDNNSSEEGIPIPEELSVSQIPLE